MASTIAANLVVTVGLFLSLAGANVLARTRWAVLGEVPYSPAGRALGTPEPIRGVMVTPAARGSWRRGWRLVRAGLALQIVGLWLAPAEAWLRTILTRL